MWQQLLIWFESLPNIAVYAVLGGGATVENVFPPIPADTFVVLGGFLAAVGDLRARWVFAATWVGNVASALAMYHLGHRYGRPLLEGPWGRRFLNGHQLQRLQGFYDRWGTQAIFLTRFVPGLRAAVPVFAGVTRQRLRSVAVPLAAASAIWYGVLVWAGAFAGHNLDVVLEVMREVNAWLVGVALLVVAALLWEWWRTRHHE
ncbi:MAG: DedA family protein [Gemmatimonadetes bacterium]|nr:DedA family protein [Gemmatimonadota bacterium]